MKLNFDSFKLENGLKVLVHEDHSVPKVVVDIVYHVGSKNESQDKTGFAHLFEHLMFEGSKHISHFDQALQRVGGSSNAFTNSDITNYYVSLPSNQLETAFWLESDRMLALDFSQKKLDVQKSVVIEEFKQRYLNQPYGDAYLQLRNSHFDVHPYKWMTIGKEISHIESATMEDVQSFFYGFYAPNNATLCVVGDVNLEEVKTLTEKWFGPIPSRTLSKKELPQEPSQLAHKKIESVGSVPLTAVYNMYHIPAHRDRAYYVADILTDILSNGKGSLLYEHMVKQQKVSPGVSAFTWGMHDPGAMSIDGKVSSDTTIEAYETSLHEVLDSLQDLSQDDLSRIQSKLKASFILQKTSFLNKAIELAVSDALGDPKLINRIPEIYESISLEEVKSAAKEFLAKENCTTLYYHPHAKTA
ncbi:MAG: pitrilysin family protein [Bacteroidota bacterium]